MGWTAAQNREYYDTARHVQHAHARLWLIMWAPAKRAYFAFYRGNAAVEPLCAPTAEQLRWGIHEIQHQLAGHQHTRAPGTPQQGLVTPTGPRQVVSPWHAPHQSG